MPPYTAAKVVWNVQGTKDATNWEVSAPTLTLSQNQVHAVVGSAAGYLNPMPGVCVHPTSGSVPGTCKADGHDTL